MSDVPRLSIVLAAYQAEDLIPVIAQRLRRIKTPGVEIVLVDDGSVDRTALMMREAALRDPRVRVIVLEANRGLGAARQVGFGAAGGEFVWNIDVDDEWPEGAVDALVGAAVDVDVVIAAATRRSPSGAERALTPPVLGPNADGAEVLTLLLKGHLSGHLWNKLIRREAIPPHAFTNARIHSDLVMVLGILPTAKRVSVLNSSVYCYVENPGSNIRSRRPRGTSLDEVERALGGALAAVPGLEGSSIARVFVARTVVLSRLRDAVRANYQDSEARARLQSARARIRIADVMAVAGAGDMKSALLLLVALVAPGVFRRIMGRTAPIRTMRE